MTSKNRKKIFYISYEILHAVPNGQKVIWILYSKIELPSTRSQ